MAEDLREEVLPKNILMIGPTGVGKTEISRRLARLAQAPFLKVEATKFTEVGYVGRDVEQIVRDLVEIAINMVRERMRKEVTAKAEAAPRNACSTRWSAKNASSGDATEVPQDAARGRARRQGDRDLEITDAGAGGLPTFDIPGMPGAQMGMINLNDMLRQGVRRGAPSPSTHDRRRVATSF